jgi:hypothetical protein
LEDETGEQPSRAIAVVVAMSAGAVGALIARFSG